jgi:hypothetical protein
MGGFLEDLDIRFQNLVWDSFSSLQVLRDGSGKPRNSLIQGEYQSDLNKNRNIFS